MTENLITIIKELDHLKSENARLREALEYYARDDIWNTTLKITFGMPDIIVGPLVPAYTNSIAREALKGEAPRGEE